MIIDSSIHCTEIELKEVFGTTLKEVAESLTLPNPEYNNIKRFGRGSFYTKVPKYLYYLEQKGTEYILPRYIFGDKSKEFSDCLSVNKGHTGRYKLKDTFSLRDYQEDFLKDYNNSITDNTGIILKVPCGHGKTVLAIYMTMLYRKSVQTLVVVPTYFLAKQWKKSIEHITTAKVYVVSSADAEIPLDSDFTIIVTDLFSVRELPDKLVENIGHVILDEAHRMGAETYLPVLQRIPAMYRTALTATFRRADGVHKILWYHFGTLCSMDNKFPKPDVYALRTHVNIRGVISKATHPTSVLLDYLSKKHIPYKETATTVDFFWDFKSELLKDFDKKFLTKKDYIEITRCINAASKLSYTSVDSYLNTHSGRRKIVIKLIKEALENGRTVLFLSKRKDVLKSLHKYFKDYKPMLIISETNKLTPKDEQYLQNECRLIFGVTQLAKEGLDIDRLDTLVIHLPLADVEQAIGRISRLHPFKKKPIAIYLLDNHPMLYSTFTKAKKSMLSNGNFVGDIELKNIIDIL